MTAEKRTTKARLIIGVAGALLLLVVGLLASGLLTEPPTEKKREAFGKLPEPAPTMAKTEALSMPVADGDFQQPEYEYKWTGGDWPDLPKAMLAYRRTNDKIDLAKAKALAAKFGLTGDPLPAEQVMPMEGQSVEGSAGSAGAPETSVDPGEPTPEIKTEMPPQTDVEPEMPPETNVEAPTDQPVREQPNYYRFYDQDSGKSLEIYEAAGTFSYHDLSVAEKIYKNAGEGPTESEAHQAAVDFLDSKGLLPTERLEPTFGPGGVVSTTVVSPDGAEPVTSEPQMDVPPQTPPYMEVNFGRKIGRYKLVEYSGEVNQYVVSVTVGPNGAIMDASGEIPAPLEESEYPLISPDAALEIISADYFGGPAALGAPEPQGMPEPMIAPAEPPASSDFPDEFIEPDPDTPIQSLPGVKEPGGAGGDAEAGSTGSGSGVTGEEPVESTITETEPPVKPDPIVIEIDQVKMGYLLATDDRGFSFYVPAYIFSGKMAGDEGSPFSAAIPAVDNK